MTPQQMQEILEQSLQDRRLSRSEKAVLSERLEAAGLNAQQRTNFRSIAFRLARETVDAVNGSLTLEWLEDVVKVLQHQAVDDEPVTAEAWFSPHNDCPQRIRTLLAQSKQTIDICVFTLTDDRLTSAVLEAHTRGVSVRIVTDNDKAADLGSDAERLLHAGVALRVDQSPYHMHHKFALFDNALLLNGSYNWTRGAAENNEENFVVTANRRLVSAFAQAFEDLWRRLDGGPTALK